MNEITQHVYDWLLELDKIEAAKFLTNCSIEHIYIDTLFPQESDIENYLCNIVIHYPLKTKNSLSNFSNEISLIESNLEEALAEYNIIIKDIEWRPCLSNSLNRECVIEEQVSKILSHEYVHKQIAAMISSIKTNPHISLGISKELIETCCKHILLQEGIKYNKEWDMPKLVKETSKVIDLVPFEIDRIDEIKASICKILGGLSTSVQGVTELRNAFGSGHGHLPNFKMLDEIYVNLAVKSSIAFVTFYLTLQDLNETNRESRIF